jgi:hypothetical protein
MLLRTVRLFVLVALLVGVSPAAPPTVLDLVSHEGPIVVAVRSLAEFKARTDKLIPETTRIVRPSEVLKKTFADFPWEIDDQKRRPSGPVSSLR